jgi:hypothetical protein
MIRMSSGDTGCTAWCTLKTVAGSSPHPPERLPAMTFPHRDPCSRHATSGLGVPVGHRSTSAAASRAA